VGTRVLKLVHAADLHIDSPLRGLDRYDGAPVQALRHATRRALENLVTLTLDEGASVLLLAGDLFDGEWRDFGTGLYFASQLARLRDGGARVVLVRGNHDASSVVTSHLRLAEHVTELSTLAPDTCVFEDLGLAVHGQGYRSRAVRDDLAAACPAPLRDLFNVGLLHTSLDGRPGHEPYAPARRETLLEKGYAYWALGHVHAREVVATEPWVVFSGNLQGRHAREVGPKGATLITVDGGKVRAVEARALDVVRWAHVAVSATDARSVDDVLERAREAVADAAREAGARLLALRITVSGLPAVGSTLASDAARLEAELRMALVSERGASVFLEKVRARLDDPRAAAAAEDLGATPDEEELERRELDRDLVELEKKLPAGLRSELEADHAGCLDEALARARLAVRAALRRPEGEP